MLMDNETNGVTFGWGDSDTTFYANETKNTAATVIKSFNISNVSGEKYINIENANAIGNTDAYIHNIWLGV